MMTKLHGAHQLFLVVGIQAWVRHKAYVVELKAIRKLMNVKRIISTRRELSFSCSQSVRYKTEYQTITSSNNQWLSIQWSRMTGHISSADFLRKLVIKGGNSCSMSIVTGLTAVLILINCRLVDWFPKELEMLSTCSIDKWSLQCCVDHRFGQLWPTCKCRRHNSRLIERNFSKAWTQTWLLSAQSRSM